MTTIISQNTTWRSGETVNLNGEVQVANGVTLTVEPGVTINGNGSTIKVFGVLNLAGSTTSHVISNNVSYSLSTFSGTNGSIQLNYVDLKDGTFLAPTGYGMYGKFDVTNSTFTNVSGFYIWYPTEPSTFIGNIFVHSNGLSIGTYGTGTVTIRNNVFFDQTTWFQTTFAVQSWANYNNGIFVDNNNFYSTTLVALEIKENYAPASIVATNNYFGTTDLSIINSMIVDRNDSLTYYSFISNSHTSTPNSLTPVFLNSAPVGSVVMSGSLFIQGATVTASNNITDSDGLGAITYKWQSSRDAITWSEFATGSSFTLTESQVGKYLRINASYIDGMGTSESVNSSSSSIVVNVNDVPSGSVSINGTIKKGSTVTASNSIADLDGIGAISYKWQSSSNLIQWADVKTGASLTIADAQVGKYLRVNATYIDGHGTNETVISDVSDLLRSGNHKPVAKPISKAVSIFENASFNFALPAGTFTDVDAGDKITYSSPNLLDGLYINPIAGTIYGKVGFTAANNPQHIITIKATDRSGAFATTQLTLKIVNVPALMGKTSIDTLIAGNGNDRIWGKGGADTLTGGSGADEFNFDASPLLGLSTITDFVPGVDKLRLSLKVFPTLGFVPSNATQTLISASLFETGSSISTATKATTRVFFNQSTSTLYYDADGLGDVAPTPIVKLMGVTTSLNSTDIYIFN